jgi:hypothetical protein
VLDLGLVFTGCLPGLEIGVCSSVRTSLNAGIDRCVLAWDVVPARLDVPAEVDGLCSTFCGTKRVWRANGDLACGVEGVVGVSLREE